MAAAAQPDAGVLSSTGYDVLTVRGSEPSPGPSNASEQEGRIPFRLWIGVTGHRDVPNDEALLVRLRSVLDQIRAETPRSPNTPACWGVISPLAEGSDQLVASEVLRDESSALEAPLPLAIDEYMKDFPTGTSKLKFQELIKRASLITLLPASRSRKVAYTQVGEYVVDHCDVLVALWDGKGAHGEGGTAEVVELARRREVPLFWIFSEPDYEVQKQHGRDVPRQPFEDVDAYNRERISTARLSENVDQQQGRWSEVATYTGMPAQELRPFMRWILPYLVRANILAERYQTYYFGFGTAMFTLAWLAVAAAAVQILSPSRLEAFALLEAFFMLVAVGLIGLARWMRVHRRWISYRALAERFRLAFFLSLAGLGAEQAASPDPTHMRPNDWTSRSFNEVWMARPKGGGRSASSLDALKRFLNEAWIDHQIRYYQRAATKNRRWEHLLGGIVGALLVCTVFVAGIHGLGALVHRGAPVPAEWLILLAIILPAAAASLGGIQAQREYESNADRFTHMAQRLLVIRRRMEAASDAATVDAITESAASAMLEEHRGWFAMMQAHAFSLHELV
jgi:hypothetical protein